MKKVFYCCLLCLLALPIHARYVMSTSSPKKVDNHPSSSNNVTTQTNYRNPSPSSQSPATLPSSSRFSQNASPSFDETATLNDLSQRFEIDLNRLQYLRGLHYGYELLVPVLAIAHEAQVDVGRVIKVKMDGASWEKVCDEFLADSKEIDKAALAVLVPLRKTIPKKYLNEKPQSRYQ